VCAYCLEPLGPSPDGRRAGFGVVGFQGLSPMHAHCYDRYMGESVSKRGLPDPRYCMQERDGHQCLMIRGHDGLHRALDSDNSEWE
jgi:hypothetical protein